MAQLIPDGDVTSWGRQINGDLIRKGLINCALTKPMVAEVQGVPVYCCRCYGVHLRKNQAKYLAQFMVQSVLA